MIKYILFCLIILFMVLPISADTNITELKDFLEIDNTDQNEYLPWYTCGHYARDLVRNASEQNITLGSVILSNHPVFRGKWNSHIINYIEINDTIYFIRPETDEVIVFDDMYFLSSYRYGRYYYNGIMVPSNWDGNLAHHFDMNKEVI